MRMRRNGYIRYEIQMDGGMNEFGEMIPALACWSDPIPCMVSTVNDDRAGSYADGEFRKASYIILIESARIAMDRVSIERYGEDLGEFRVLSVEPIPSMGRIKIMV